MKLFSHFRKHLNEHVGAGSLPPNILILRRKSVRAFPDSMVALYYNDKLDQYFSVPFGGDVENTITPASLKEDVESLDELNTPTLGSYLSKSVEQVKGHQAPFKRYKGMSRAISKLNLRTGHPDPKKSQAAKDALNLQEDAISHLRKVVNFETNTALKHKDGKQTKVDPTTAKALLTVHDALSKENQPKFAEHLEKSKDHFHRMVEFTWKQVK